MTISCLPQQVANQLDATLNITSAVVLVKELVDNALDAGATSIFVSISKDTLEEIEVTDNGRGIQANDFDALGRLSHTSKLGGFDELQTIGGSSLGFRGLALASINSVAEVTVVTRTARDKASAVLRLQTGGGVESKGIKSGTVGTTVSVSNVFARQPVRAQEAKKPLVQKKTIAKIKELLQSYALARPHTKIRFKVVGDDKLTFSYSPQEKLTIKETVMQVLGSDLAKQCRVHTTPRGIEAGENQGRSGYQFDALLPCMDADFSKLSAAPFFSVDSRPLGSTRGTMKKMYIMYKSCLNGAFGQSTQNLKSPFLRLDIKCPPGAYDPNIEPTKNDVLFTHEETLLKSFDCFLREVYASSQPQVEAEPHGGVAAQCYHGPSCLESQSSAVMTATDSTEPTGLISPPGTGTGIIPLLSGEPEVPQKEPVDEEDRKECGSRGGVWHQEHQAFPLFSVDMSAPTRTHDGIDEEDESDVTGSAPGIVEQNAEVTDQEQSSDPLENVNPWSLAKMTAPKRRVPVAVEHSSEIEIPNAGHHRPDTPFVDDNLPVLRQPFLPDGDLDVPRSPHEQLARLVDRLESQEGMSQDQRRSEHLEHLVDRLETPGVMTPARQPRSPPPARGPHNHLQSPPTSSPVFESRNRASQPDRRSLRRGGMQQTRLNFGGLTKRSQHRSKKRAAEDENVDIQENETPPRRARWTAINAASETDDSAADERQYQAVPEERTSLRQGQLPTFRPHFVQGATFKPRGESMAGEGQGEASPVYEPGQRQLVDFTTGRGRSRQRQNSADQANALSVHEPGQRQLLDFTTGRGRPWRPQNSSDQAIVGDVDLSEPMQIELSGNDSRAYLLRRQRSMATKTPRKRRRVMDDLLPLEKVTADGDKSIRQVLEVQPRKLGNELALRFEPYACGQDCNFATLTDSVARDREEQVKRLVKDRKRNGLAGSELVETSSVVASDEETGCS